MSCVLLSIRTKTAIGFHKLK